MTAASSTVSHTAFSKNDSAISSPPTVAGQCSAPAPPPARCRPLRKVASRRAIDAEDALKKQHHSCPTCKRGFTSAGHLARHVKIHSGEKKHKCPFPGCATSCSRQDNLQQHYRIHLSPGAAARRKSGRPSVIRAMGFQLPPPQDLYEASPVSPVFSAESASSSRSSFSSSASSSGSSSQRSFSPPLTPPPLEDSTPYLLRGSGFLPTDPRRQPATPPPAYIDVGIAVTGGGGYIERAVTPEPLLNGYPRPKLEDLAEDIEAQKGVQAHMAELRKAQKSGWFRVRVPADPRALKGLSPEPHAEPASQTAPKTDPKPARKSKQTPAVLPAIDTLGSALANALSPAYSKAGSSVAATPASSAAPSPAFSYFSSQTSPASNVASPAMEISSPRYSPEHLPALVSSSTSSSVHAGTQRIIDLDAYDRQDQHLSSHATSGAPPSSVSVPVAAYDADADRQRELAYGNGVYHPEHGYYEMHLDQGPDSYQQHDHPQPRLEHHESRHHHQDLAYRGLQAEPYVGEGQMRSESAFQLQSPPAACDAVYTEQHEGPLEIRYGRQVEQYPQYQLSPTVDSGYYYDPQQQQHHSYQHYYAQYETPSSPLTVPISSLRRSAPQSNAYAEPTPYLHQPQPVSPVDYFGHVQHGWRQVGAL
ncbi:unnamed protein product [Mycena citricolor]|uniref:C2H2-type domain-containing protein n=1 Tax=Mycena citricolor TaxID=2018698 RepID=A0AAD2Q2G5_9AGAR|nr:unnamed protein product [Mycena citricolor]